RRRDLVTGYMPQVSGLDDATTVHANILSGAQRILELIAEYERVPGDSPLSATLLDQIGEADGWNLEHRIKSLITNLHAPESGRARATPSSGGGAGTSTAEVFKTGTAMGEKSAPLAGPNRWTAWNVISRWPPRKRRRRSSTSS